MEEGNSGADISCILAFISVPVMILILVIVSVLEPNKKSSSFRILKEYQERLRTERQTESIADFEASFADSNVPQKVLRAVHRVVGGSAIEGVLPPHRNDSLIQEYGWYWQIDEEPLLRQVAQWCGVGLDRLNNSGDTPRSVAGLVFLASRAIENQANDTASSSLLRASDPDQLEPALLRPAKSADPNQDQLLLRPSSEEADD